MDNQEKKDGTVNQNAVNGKACCAPKCCGKSLAVIALLAIGGAGGYLAARCCAPKTAAAVEAPGQPAK